MKEINPNIHRKWLRHQIVKLRIILNGVKSDDEKESTINHLVDVIAHWDECLKQYEEGQE